MYALLNDAIQHMLGSSIIPKLSIWILVQENKMHLSITSVLTTSGAAFPGTTDNISLRTAPNRGGTPLTWESISVFSGGKKVQSSGPPFQ